MSFTVSTLSLIKAKSLFKIIGPMVRANRRMIKGPARADINVVSQGEVLDREEYQEDDSFSCSLL